MKGNKFDDIIAKKLANIAPEKDTNSWKLFEEKLDAVMSAGEEPSLPASSFDGLIFDKLHYLPPQKDALAWSRFEQKLDALPDAQPFPASSFDQMIATRLNKQQPPFNHHHWIILKNRLDWISFIANRIALYKFSELALLMIFLFFLGEAPLPVDLPVAETVQPASGKTASGKSADTNDLTLNEAIPETEEQTPFRLSEQTADPTFLAPSSQKIKTAGEQPPAPSRKEKPSPQNRKNKALDEYPAAPTVSIIDPLLPLNSRGLTVLPAGEAFLAPLAFGLPEITRAATNADRNTTGMALLETKPVLLQKESVSLAEFVKPAAERKSAFHITMMGALDYNRIITPENKAFRLTEFDRYEVGYGGGFLVGMEKGRWGFQTGGVYSFKHIRPIRVAYLEGNFDRGYLGEVLKEYDYSAISIPLHFTYDVFRKKAWRLYAVAGASLNIVYESNYYVVLNRGKNVGGYGLSGSNFGVASTATTRTQLDEANFPRGYFQGGTFAENSYLTTNIGLGVERFLEDRWSIFAQPTYQHGFLFMNEGLGPFQDQLRTMSFFTGIRVRLVK